MFSATMVNSSTGSSVSAVAPSSVDALSPHATSAVATTAPAPRRRARRRVMRCSVMDAGSRKWFICYSVYDLGVEIPNEAGQRHGRDRWEGQTSERQYLMGQSDAGFCMKKKNNIIEK